MDTNRNKNQHKNNNISQYCQRFWRHEVRHQLFSDGVNLVTSADEDEAGEEDVDDGVVGDEDQHPAGVRAQEDVVLSYEHLHIKTTFTKEN